eukprot:Awhi_evm1s1854
MLDWTYREKCTKRSGCDVQNSPGMSNDEFKQQALKQRLQQLEREKASLLQEKQSLLEKQSLQKMALLSKKKQSLKQPPEQQQDVDINVNYDDYDDIDFLPPYTP